MGRNRPRVGDEDEKPVVIEDELPPIADEDEWEAFTRGVRPIGDRDEPGDAAPDLPEVGLADRLRVKQEQSAGAVDPGPFALDRRTAERLRRGQIAIESQLDLHGMTQEEALTSLDAFLLQSWADGQRCVLVITGKGTAREGGGVLRTMIPAWLAEGEHRHRILAVESAQPRHGGDGAT